MSEATGTLDAALDAALCTLSSVSRQASQLSEPPSLSFRPLPTCHHAHLSPLHLQVGLTVPVGRRSR